MNPAAIIFLCCPSGGLMYHYTDITPEKSSARKKHFGPGPGIAKMESSGRYNPRHLMDSRDTMNNDKSDGSVRAV
ncbi:MAG: hypothetical protein Q7U14_17585, partial [Lacisediminimonas sp.]|nr:hypothetical protein [Lacisediminimonas sp.]